MREKMIKYAIVSMTALTLLAPVWAAEVPLLDLRVTVDGSTLTTTQAGQLTEFNDYKYKGSLGDGFPITSWIVGWDLVSNTGATSFVTNGFTVTNLDSATKNFNIVLNIPDVLPGDALPWEFFGNIGGTLTSDSSSSGATLSSIGSNPLWQGLRQGASPGTNSELMSNFTFSSPSLETNTFPLVAITPYIVSGGTGKDMGYQFNFNLTGNSTVSFTGVWGGTKVVPTPGALALCGVAGMLFKRHRRTN